MRKITEIIWLQIKTETLEAFHGNVSKANTEVGHLETSVTAGGRQPITASLYFTTHSCLSTALPILLVGKCTFIMMPVQLLLLHCGGQNKELFIEGLSEVLKSFIEWKHFPPTVQKSSSPQWNAKWSVYLDTCATSRCDSLRNVAMYQSLLRSMFHIFSVMGHIPPTLSALYLALLSPACILMAM